MKVRSWATCKSDNRHPNAGMPSAEGAAAVAGNALPLSTNRIMDDGSADSTDEFPAIFGNAPRAPSPFDRWQAAQLSR